MYCKKHILILFCFVFLWKAADAQIVKYLNINSGLSSNQVFQVEKDETGFIWFVTYTGINRYDGSHIKRYKLSSENRRYENYPSYTLMTTNRKGEIIVAMQDGNIFRYNKQIDDFERLVDIKEKIQYRDILLMSVYCDTQNRLWIASNYGIHLFNTDNGDIRYLTLFDNDYPSCVTQDEKGNYYAGSSKYLYQLSESVAGYFTITQKIVFDRQYGKVLSLLSTQNKLYIGTAQKGVFVYDSATGASRSLFPQIPHNAVRALKQMSDHRIVAGIDGSGVYILPAGSDIPVAHYDSDSNSENSLSSNSVYDILPDENNCLWITTFANGVNVIDPLMQGISMTRHERSVRNSLINNQVNAVFEDSDGNLWYGTNNGVSYYSPEQKKWTHYLDDEKQKIVIISLCEDAQHHIWAGSYGAGAFRIDRKTGRIVSFRKNENQPHQSINTNFVYSLYADRQSVWLGGLSGAMTRYDIFHNTFEYHDIEVMGAITPLNDRALLLGTPIGFCLFDIATSHFKKYIDFKGDGTNYAVRRFYVVGEDEVWLGTEGCGLIRFNPQTEEFRFFTTENGLPSDFIYSIEGDGLGRIWITNERTLSCFDIRNEQFTDMGEYTGLNNICYSFSASERRKNNRLVFGSSDGAIEFPSKMLSGTKLQAKLVFTDFKLFYQSVKIGAPKSPLQCAVNETGELTLAYNQNSFSFLFSSINYRAQNQIIYAYMLEGFDKDWNIISGNDAANYTNIPSGKYHFKLKALNRNTKQVIDERNIRLQIHPPFWLSPWAWIVYLLLAIILIRFIWLYAKNTMEKRQSKEKIRFFVNMAHDIRTPVSLIKAPLNDLAENENFSENGKTALDIAIRNTEKLFLMVTQLLDFQKADMLSLRLVVSRNELKSYLQEKLLLFQVEAARKNISLYTDISFDSLHVWFDREKMDKIIANLLTNAIKYTGNNGSVRIACSQDDKYWYLSIADTGIGIPLSEQKYLFNRFFRARNAINSQETGSGIGLLLTRELIRLHGGNISFVSKENVGTEFKLTFAKDKPDCAVEDEIDANPLQEQTSDEKPQIVLAEDNNDMRQYLKNKLSELYSVFEVADGLAALEKIETVQPDLIISDCLMPGINGEELCVRLKNNVETSHIPIILLTALSDKANIIKGLECGADDYITKPFDVNILKARIQNLLKNREKLKMALTSPATSDNLPEYGHPLDKEFIEKAIRLIEENLDDSEFSINDLSQGMAMSRSSLFNKLKALTGQGPNDFIRTIRLNKAKEFLLSKQYNVFETSVMTGFVDSKYFSVAFKKQFGISPSKIGK